MQYFYDNPNLGRFDYYIIRGYNLGMKEALYKKYDELTLVDLYKKRNED